MTQQNFLSSSRALDSGAAVFPSHRPGQSPGPLLRLPLLLLATLAHLIFAWALVAGQELPGPAAVPHQVQTASADTAPSQP